MLLNNIPNQNDGDEDNASCDCCDEDCDCGDCKQCSGEEKDDDDLLTGDNNYINEYSDGNVEVDSHAYGRSLDSDDDDKDFN